MKRLLMLRSNMIFLQIFYILISLIIIYSVPKLVFGNKNQRKCSQTGVWEQEPKHTVFPNRCLGTSNTLTALSNWCLGTSFMWLPYDRELLNLCIIVRDYSYKINAGRNCISIVVNKIPRNFMLSLCKCIIIETLEQIA